MRQIKVFFLDERAAVTVDWVALTAGILLLGIMVIYAIFNNGVSSLVTSIEDTVTDNFVAIDIGTIENLNQ